MRTKAAVFLLAGALTACADEPPVEEAEPAEPPLPDVGFALDEAAFDAPAVPDTIVPFDVVTADLELDGDPDVIINWHNLASPELFANQGGGFYLINRAGSDRAGLWENPGIPSLYGDNDEMLAKARARATAGVFVWHEPNRRGDWQILVVPDDEPVSLRLRGNGALTPRLGEQFLEERGEMEAALSVDRELHFGVDVAWVASQLVVEASLPVFAGAELTELGERAELWKDDPHGIAWLDALGSGEPDVFITRGGLMGTLQPPLDAKRDRFFEYTGHAGGIPLYADRRDLVPASYGRGRRVAWVDVDGDGTNELYIGNTATPNELLARARAEGGGDARDARDEPPSAWRDIAPDYSIDFDDGDVFAWVDIDDDGLDDLVFVDASGFQVAINRGNGGNGDNRGNRGNRGGGGFEVVAGEEIGLVFPGEGAPAAGEELFNTLALNVLDFDNDGVLDLWLSGYGEQHRHALFRGTRDSGGAYVDVTEEVGLGAVALSNRVVFLDVENDGDLDALSLGGQATWLHNQSGQRFAFAAVDDAWRLREFTHAAPLDADGDGLLDVVLVDRRRMLARNVSAGAGGALRVVLRGERGDPVGTVVTAVYSDGTTAAQRFGSASTTKLSQGTAPLHFGIAEGAAIERLEVRWPGGRRETRAVAAGETLIELHR